MIENRWVCDDFVEHSDLMTLTIREATADDSDAIADSHVQAWRVARPNRMRCLFPRWTGCPGLQSPWQRSDTRGCCEPRTCRADHRRRARHVARSVKFERESAPGRNPRHFVKCRGLHNNGGEGGIRTPGGLPHTAFPRRRTKPGYATSPSASIVASPTSVSSLEPHGFVATFVALLLPGEVDDDLAILQFTVRRFRWRPGPVQHRPVNRVRVGRQQLSAMPDVCRRSPGRLLKRRISFWRRGDRWTAFRP
jgi:hypothetical protein